MELWKEILAQVLAKEEIHVSVPNLQLNAAEILEMECYQSLQRIKTIIEDDSLSDFECVEEIVVIFERMGSDGGIRHDFG